jgi:hypothetical protein
MIWGYAGMFESDLGSASIKSLRTLDISNKSNNSNKRNTKKNKESVNFLGLIIYQTVIGIGLSLPQSDPIKQLSLHCIDVMYS